MFFFTCRRVSICFQGPFCACYGTLNVVHVYTDVPVRFDLTGMSSVAPRGCKYAVGIPTHNLYSLIELVNHRPCLVVTADRVCSSRSTVYIIGEPRRRFENNYPALFRTTCCVRFLFAYSSLTESGCGWALVFHLCRFFLQLRSKVLLLYVV